MVCKPIVIALESASLDSCSLYFPLEVEDLAVDLQFLPVGQGDCREHLLRVGVEELRHEIEHRLERYSI